MSTLFDDVDPAEDHEADVDYVAAVAKSLNKNVEDLTVEDLAKKAFHGDRHITRLETDLGALRTDLNTRVTLEEVMSEIKTARQPGEASRETHQSTESSNKVEGLKEEDVVRLLQNERQKAVHDQNIAQVRSNLAEMWGKGYRTKLKEVGEDLGLTEEEMGNMAATRPKVFMKLIGADAQPATRVNPQATLAPITGVRTRTNQAPERTYDYYKKLHKENPKLYWDPKTREQMYQDLEKIGPDAFLGNNK